RFHCVIMSSCTPTEDHLECAVVGVKKLSLKKWALLHGSQKLFVYRLSVRAIFPRRHYECAGLETADNGLGSLHCQIPILIIPVRLGFAALRCEKFHSVIL